MKKVITAIVALVILALMAWGYAESAAHHGHGDAKVNPKETIFEHLGDTYGWEVPFSHTKKISLPIIAFAKGGGRFLMRETTKASWFKCLMMALNTGLGTSLSRKTCWESSLRRHW